MNDLAPCPKCNCAYTYQSDHLIICPECFYEWNPNELKAEEPGRPDINSVVKDIHGNVLIDGDSIIVMKDLPVKGALRPVKAGTKVKNIKLSDGDHNISCKIDGFGSMALKSEFVRKA